MVHNRYTNPPMTLGNMRANGVRLLSVACHLCHHQAVMNMDRFEDAVPVPSFGPRMVCTSCGIVGADVRPELAGARRTGEPDRPAVALNRFNSATIHGALGSRGEGSQNGR